MVSLLTQGLTGAAAIPAIVPESFMKSAMKYAGGTLAMSLAPSAYQGLKQVIGDLANREDRIGDVARAGIDIVTDTVNDFKEGFKTFFGGAKKNKGILVLQKIGGMLVRQLPSYLQDDAQVYLQDFIKSASDYLDEDTIQQIENNPDEVEGIMGNYLGDKLKEEQYISNVQGQRAKSRAERLAVDPYPQQLIDKEMRNQDLQFDQPLNINQSQNELFDPYRNPQSFQTLQETGQNEEYNNYFPPNPTPIVKGLLGKNGGGIRKKTKILPGSLQPVMDSDWLRRKAEYNSNINSANQPDYILNRDQ